MQLTSTIGRARNARPATDEFESLSLPTIEEDLNPQLRYRSYSGCRNVTKLLERTLAVNAPEVASVTVIATVPPVLSL
jgi:hypothetical protein